MPDQTAGNPSLSTRSHTRSLLPPTREHRRLVLDPDWTGKTALYSYESVRERNSKIGDTPYM